MFPLWEDVVGPVLGAARPRLVVEIGALRGENTELLLSRLPSDAELHVVDPLPDFDPAEHEARFAGHYVFHRDLSLNVLGGLPPMDAAIVDGDHNWYTVRNELQLLADVSRRAGRPLPLLVLHDVAWPYGRRDLYYDPDTIPDEFRQKWHRAGMRPNQAGLVMAGGLNPTMANAAREGGERNGVMTALEDFIAAYDRPLRLVVVPIYFGLAIVAEQAVLDERPGAGGRARPAREPRRHPAAARAVGAHPHRRPHLPAQRLLRPRARRRPGRRPLPRQREAGLDRRVLPRERGAAVDPGRPRRARHASRPEPVARSGPARRRGLPPPAGVPEGRDAPARRPGAGIRLRLVAARSRRTRPAPRVPRRPAPRHRPRRPRRLRHRPRWHRHLPAGLPDSLRPTRAPALGDQPVPGGGRRSERSRRPRRPARSAGRSQPGARRLRAVRPARRRRALPAGRSGGHAGRRADRAPGPDPHRCRHRRRSRPDARAPVPEAGRRRVRGRRRRVRRRDRERDRAVPVRPRRDGGDRAGGVGRAPMAQGGRTGRARRGGCPGSPRRQPRTAGHAGAHRHARPVGGGGRLQHAPRGRPHAARPVTRLPAAGGRPRLRGDRRRERLGAGPATGRGARARLRARVPLPRPRRRGRSVPDQGAEHRDQPVGRHLARADDRRGPRRHPGRPPLRHGRAA